MNSSRISKSLCAPSKYCKLVHRSFTKKPLNLSKLGTSSSDATAPTLTAAHSKFRSNAEYLIAQVPVVEVDGYLAVCDGGGGTLGHPVEYIQLNTQSNEPQMCKYCGLRYIKSKNAVHHH